MQIFSGYIHIQVIDNKISVNIRLLYKEKHVLSKVALFVHSYLNYESKQMLGKQKNVVTVRLGNVIPNANNKMMDLNILKFFKLYIEQLYFARVKTQTL